jgi:hypothetical protein
MFDQINWVNNVSWSNVAIELLFKLEHVLTWFVLTATLKKSWLNGPWLVKYLVETETCPPFC